MGLKFPDDFHCSDLGCTRNGTTRECVKQGLHRRNTVGKFRANVADEVMNVPVGLKSKEFVDFHASGFRVQAQIIAEKIDDHQVFGKVLF